MYNFNVGDMVTCKADLSFIPRTISTANYAGMGYSPGKVFIVKKIDRGATREQDILWPKGYGSNGYGVYARACVLTTELTKILNDIRQEVNVQGWG